MLEGQQQQLIADIRISEANAARISRFRGREKPASVARRKLPIGKRKKVRKRLERQTEQSKRIHDAPKSMERLMVAQFTFEGAPFPGFKSMLD
jgi:hypothetical protein